MIIVCKPSSGIGGHAGVAAWVSTNSSKVLAYYPMSDATASGTMADSSGNGRDGTYSAGVASGVLSGQTMADLDGSSGYATVTSAAWMDSIQAMFCVYETDSSKLETFVCRDPNGSDRRWQWRQNGVGGASTVEFIQVAVGNPTKSATTSAAATGRMTTAGVAYISGAIAHFFDGSALTNSGGSPIFETGSANMEIGRTTGSTTPTQYFHGRLGSVVLLDSTGANATDMGALHDAWTNP